MNNRSLGAFPASTHERAGGGVSSQRGSFRLPGRLAVVLGAFVALSMPSTAQAGTVTVACAGNTAADTAEFNALDGCTNLLAPCSPTDTVAIQNLSCTPDFGSRTFHNIKKIVVPNAGAFSVTAGEIIVDAKINGKHAKVAPEGDGTDVSLIAVILSGSTGNITINKKVNVSGRLTEGSITINAEGNVAVNHQLVARGQGGSAPTAPGGTITIDADGNVTSGKRGKIVVRGKKKVTPAGTVSIFSTGLLGIDLKGRIEARGLYGGTVSAQTSGDVNIEEEIRAYGEFGSGGSVQLSAGGTKTVKIGGKKGTVRANGGAPDGGGFIGLMGGTIDAVKLLTARGTGTGNGGFIQVTGGDPAGTVALRTLKVQGANGGLIQVTGASTAITIAGSIDADGTTGTGGDVFVFGGGDITVNGPVFANGMTDGGELRVGTGGNIVLGTSKKSKFEANGDSGDGGVIEGQGNNIDVAGEFSALPSPNGCIGMVAGGTLTVTAGSMFDPGMGGAGPQPNPNTSMCP